MFSQKVRVSVQSNFPFLRCPFALASKGFLISGLVFLFALTQRRKPKIREKDIDRLIQSFSHS